MKTFRKLRSGLLVPVNDILCGGKFHGKIIRAGRVIDEFDCKNLVVNQGLNYMLGAALGNQGAIANWYLGLFTGNYTPVASDTASTFPGNATETNAYTYGSRVPYQPYAPASQSISNSLGPSSFTFNGNITVYGAFLVSNSVIGGTTGTLFSAAQFGASKSVVNNDQLVLTYTFSATSS